MPTKPKFHSNPLKRSAYIGGVSTYKIDSDLPVVFIESAVFVAIDDKFNQDDYAPEVHGRYIRIGSLLSEDKTNAKLVKSAKNTSAKTLIYYGAPAASSGITNTCSHATKDCISLCLNTSGNGRYASNQLARIARTRFKAYHPATFDAYFRAEIDYHLSKLDGKDFLAIRPNGTTDQFDSYLDAIIDDYPAVRFYDYTAVPSRLKFARSNYDVTLSRKETNSNHNWLQRHYRKQNVAVVVTQEIKRELLEIGQLVGINVVDFDQHDLRLPEMDGTNVIGLLTPKGKAKGKASGFIVSSIDQLLEEITGAE